jgi:hypothetical protein
MNPQISATVAGEEARTPDQAVELQAVSDSDHMLDADLSKGSTNRPPSTPPTDIDTQTSISGAEEEFKSPDRSTASQGNSSDAVEQRELDHDRRLLGYDTEEFKFWWGETPEPYAAPPEGEASILQVVVNSKYARR